ncbi:hypothetical protein C3L33_13375, partial [Rhododendron williamsianum]
MVFGLRSKNRKGGSVQVDYFVTVHEIKPWPPSKSLKSVQSVFLQWENGDQNIGSFASVVGNDNIDFNECFALPVTLCQEKRDSDHFQKNCLQFYLYESRKDKAGQHLGTAIINLADYGIIEENLTISALVNCKKSSKNAAQPVLYVSVRPIDTESYPQSPNGSLSKEASLDKHRELVSNLMKEVNDDELEIASFTDDDGSSHSSRTTSSSAFEANKGSLSQNKEVADGKGKNQEKAQQSVRDHVVEKIASSDEYIQKGSLASFIGSQANGHPYEQVVTHRKNSQPDTTTVNEVHVGLVDDMEKTELREYGQDKPSVKEMRSFLENKSSLDATRKHATPRSETVAFSRRAYEVESTALTNNKLRHMNSVQLPFISAKSSEVSDISQNTEKAKEVHKPGSAYNNGTSNAATEGNKPSDGSSNRKLGVESTAITSNKLRHTNSVQLPFTSAKTSKFSDGIQDMEVQKPKSAYNNGTSNASTEGKKPSDGFSDSKLGVEGTAITSNKLRPTNSVQRPLSLGKTGEFSDRSQNTEKAKEVHKPKSAYNNGASNAATEGNKPTDGFSDSKFEWKSRVEMLEEELREAAVVEAALYSVVAEHGSSMIKVHAPARRLSRFYLHACKTMSHAKRANAASAAVSGLILVSKSCGNDVPRLSFWLSNSIMLRAIVNQSVQETNGGRKGSAGRSSLKRNTFSSTTKKKNHPPQELGDWENPQTFVVALERIEAWIFSRIVESVWWQTLTPHMQSAATKTRSSSSRRSKYAAGDQEQGSFSIELWKKAFKDACERLCPIRAGGHECGCLPLLARLVMEQLVDRLDVAMFNAILRESAEEIPTDPVSDPISDPRVLPILACRSSFGSGAQLKNAIGNWSRWLTDLFGIEDNDSAEDETNHDDNSEMKCVKSFKAFRLLNALSDLMMLPTEMLGDSSIRKEVCPTFCVSLIKRVLSNFVPDEFSPHPIPAAVLEALDVEDAEEDATEELVTFPCTAAPTIYSPPPAASLAGFIGEVGSQTLQTSRSSLLRKSYTSDDELDELDSPMTSIIIDNSRISSSSTRLTSMPKGGRNIVRYQLLREVWKDGE